MRAMKIIVYNNFCHILSRRHVRYPSRIMHCTNTCSVYDNMYMCVVKPVITVQTLVVCMISCTIDAWAFKGTATGYISHVPQ